ncbi:MAG: AEC family transporter [Paracoccaceae bacterium]
MFDLFDFFNLLVNGVIPVSFICFFGFFLGKKNLFEVVEANIILKFVGIVAVPAMSVDIILKLNFENINFSLYIKYLITELTLYFLGFITAKIFFKSKMTEAILIGAASSFANHVLYVYPIAILEFPFSQINSIITIMAMDVLLLSLTILLLDLASTKDFSLVKLIKKQSVNPPLLGLIIGLFIILIPYDLPVGIERTFEFISLSAAPCALFALGIILSKKINWDQFKIAVLITFLRLIIHPLLAFFVILLLGGHLIENSRTTLMVAAAPVGLMAFTFAPKYNVRTEAIALSILWTFIASMLLIPIVGIIQI